MDPCLWQNIYFSFLPMFTDKRKENTILKLNLINNNKLYHCVFINLLPRIGMLHCNSGSWWFASIIFSLKLSSSTILTYLSSPAKFCKQFEQDSNVTVNQDSLIAPQVWCLKWTKSQSIIQNENRKLIKLSFVIHNLLFMLRNANCANCNQLARQSISTVG